MKEESSKVQDVSQLENYKSLQMRVFPVPVQNERQIFLINLANMEPGFHFLARPPCCLHGFAKFKYFAKQFILTESPDHVFPSYT